MVTPITQNITVTLQDIPTASQQTDVTPATIQESIASQTTKTTSPQQKTQDTVALSSRSLAMSKALNEQENTKLTSDTPQNTQTQNKQPDGGEIKPDISSIKRYPPFLGDPSQLKALKQYSPALYREILRMIVPPPIDVSFSDLQMLKNYTQDKPVT